VRVVDGKFRMLVGSSLFRSRRGATDIIICTHYTEVYRSIQFAWSSPANSLRKWYSQIHNNDIASCLCCSYFANVFIFYWM